MKFAAHLNGHLTPEWRSQYVSYEEFKSMLYSAIDNAPPVDTTSEENLKRYYQKFDQKFFAKCEEELNKINMFFTEKSAEAHRKAASLQSELTALKFEPSLADTGSNKEKLRRRKAEREFAKKISELKLAFSEFYLSLILLQNYQSLNFTGFRKILKKYDKLMESDQGGKFHATKVEHSTFYSNKKIDRMINDCEEIFIAQLENGNRSEAMRRLRVPPIGVKQSPKNTFLVGLFLGTLITLIGVIAVSSYYTISYHKDYIDAYISIYRGLFLLILFVGLLGANAYGWNKYGVNHVLIFELDPRSHLSFPDLLQVSFGLGTIWCASLIVFLFSPLLQIPTYISPLVCVSLFVLMFINPLPIMKRSARLWLMKYLFRIITAPYYSVTFPDFWLADQLNSMGKVFLDFEFCICFYTFELQWHTNYTHLIYRQDDVCGSGAYGVRIFVSLLPAWFRFAQCLRRYYDSRKVFPHLVNAGKYSTTFLVVPLAYSASIYRETYGKTHVALTVCWTASKLISSTYALAWDLKQDWGLFTFENKESPFLREQTVYPSKLFYYFAIVEDVTLRYIWIAAFVNKLHHYMNSLYLECTLAILEVIRRFVWNYLRLENEHLNNCGEFRATRDISIAPIQVDHLSVLCEMMDKPQMVVKRRYVPKDDVTTNEDKQSNTSPLVSYSPSQTKFDKAL